MKLFVILGLTWAIAAGSCQPADPTQTPCDPTAVSVKAPTAEVTALKQYLDTNRISATADNRGFYYTIQSPGSGAKPTICNQVTVNYSGKLTNGSSFDSASGVTFNLNGLILGWQEGIPLIAPGGSITLYLPPSLAYGAGAQGSIPGNSILIFTIDLIRVN